MNKRGLVLFAHGARDARWAQPFRQILAAVAGRLPDVATRLAFLEVMQPDLESAIRDLVGQGCKEIRVAPLFFGRGGHLREDVPRLAALLAVQFPDIEITYSEPAGEDQVVRDAIAEFCVRSFIR